jgi:hypothetical protein
VRRTPFDRVVLYGLAPLLRDEAGAHALGALVQSLHAAGARTVGAPIANVRRLAEVLHAGEVDAAARLDELVTEDEYWNRCARSAVQAGDTERADCFAPFVDLVGQLREAAARAAAGGRRVRVGAYLGYPTPAEVRRLGGLLDFVLLDYPVRSPELGWEHVHGKGGPLRDRFRWCAGAGLEIWPILYARGEVSIGPWLRSHGLAAAEDAFIGAATRDQAFTLSRSHLIGFQYFADDAL